MKFYHRTSEAAWAAIQAEGILFGIGMSRRHTYLAPEDFGPSYGPVLLEVDYEPAGRPQDNYGFNPPPGEICWQFAVFVPIPLAQVSRVSPDTLEGEARWVAKSKR